MPDFAPQSKPLDPSGFRSGELQTSKLRFYSIGIVAANKDLKSKIIEVVPTEEVPMLDGEINSDKNTIATKGEDSDGKSYHASLDMTNSIKAEWLPFCDSQRLTAPDVRRGESVVIYQFGDADKFYWTTLKNDNRLRKLETVIWAFSGTQKEDTGELTPETSYYLEVSTHKKMVTFHTSQANQEAFGYDIQINAKDSKVVITDTAGNEFLIDSPAQHVRLKNSAGSYAEIIKNVANFYASESINAKTSLYTVTADTVQMKSSGATTINAGSTANIRGDSSATFSGGKATVNGDSGLALVAPSITSP